MANTLGKFQQMPLTPAYFIRKLINNQNRVITSVEIFIALFLTLIIQDYSSLPLACHTTLDYVEALRKMI